jgi:Mg2+/citrate symporter
MLALLGFATIAVFLILIMPKRLSVITALVLVPLILAMDPHGKALSYGLLEMEI